MKSVNGDITDHSRGAREMGIERGRQALKNIGPLGLAPVWIAAGALAGLAAVVLRSRHPTTSTPSEGSRRVADVMITDVQAIAPDVTLVEAARRMHQENVGVLPIVQDGRVIGVITDRDLVVRALTKDDIDPSSVRVMDCATRDPVLGHPSWMLERALLVMAEQQIGRLPVVDDAGQLVGLITLSSVALRSQKTEEAMVAAKKIASRSARGRTA